jgi:hypothetical protein
MPVVRWVTYLGILIVIGSTVGLTTTPALGALGPALAWIGILVLPVVLTTIVVTLRLVEQHPHIQASLGFVGAGGITAGLIGLLVIVVLELQYRASHPIPPMQLSSKDTLMYLQRADPILGWRGSPNYSRPMDFRGGPRQFTTNSRGFRDIEQDVDPKRPHVVIIGDSFPIGWGSDVEDSIATHLRRTLAEAQIFNASWQSYGKDQVAWSYRVLAKPLRPKVVVMMLLSNPFRDTSKPLYFGLRKPHYLLEGGKLVLAGSPVQHYKDEETNRLYFQDWQAQRINGPASAWHYLTRDFILENSAFGQRVLNTLERREINGPGVPPIDAVESKILSNLKAEIEADGAHLIVVPAPRPEFFRFAAKPAQAMERHLDGYRDLGIDTVDITTLLLTAWKSCFNRDAHPNALASQRIALPLADRIRPYLRDK